MTDTQTSSNTFTLTNAKYLASKVAADLLQMQMYYGSPSDIEIDNYIEELVTLVLGGYLDSVDYGFKRGNDWVVVVKYSAKYGTTSSTDDHSGGVFPGADISQAKWSSFLRKNSVFSSLPQAERERIENLLPIKRTSGSEPGFVSGTFVADKNYYSGGNGLERKIFKPY